MGELETIVVVGIVGVAAGLAVGVWLVGDERLDEVRDLKAALLTANEDLAIADQEIARLDATIARYELERTKLRRGVEAMVEHCRKLETD